MRLWPAKLLACAIAPCALALISCTTPPYFPDKKISANPAQVGLNYEPVSLRTSDGVALSGWFAPAPNPRATVLFCHGNAGNISHQLDRLTLYHNLDLNVLVFDYRGYGKSHGRPSEQGLYRDAEAAWTYLTSTRHIPPDKIVVVGHSLGGPVAAHLASQHRPGALVLESTFTSMDDEVAAKAANLPVGSLVKGDFQTADFISKVHCPLLVVHSTQDTLVPYALGRQLFERANPPKQFLEITGTHNDGFLTSGGTYTAGFEWFLNTYMLRAESKSPDRNERLSEGTQP